MRQRNGDPEKKQFPAVLEKKYSDIVVGTGRSQEPYIIAFHYASDNVSGSSLGTLFGFFEVEIHDQDAAYIVNFLASVAKKEYFTNPRRGSIESFDAALHKINVALAEIVKHGNISWLGHLHGAIGAVSKNTLHFSVTGEGAFFLARNETFRSISEGLADALSEPHPLKTFTEVSSGELFDGDLLIAFSPAIWSLFSPEDLRRSLLRLGPAGFEQFLRTALINELPIAAAVLLTCSTPITPPTPLQEKTPKTQKKAITLENVFSGKPFSEASQNRRAEVPTEITASLKKEEYTDKKTGHIYVQASPDESFETPNHPWKEQWGLFVEQLSLSLRSFQQSLQRSSRRISKETGFVFDSFKEGAARGGRTLGRRARSFKRSLEEKREVITLEKEITKKATDTPPTKDTPPLRGSISTPSEPSVTSQEKLRLRMERHLETLKPTFHEAKQNGAAFWEKALSLSSVSIGWIRRFLYATGVFWKSRSPKERLVLAGIVTIIAFGIIATVAWPETPKNKNPAPTTITSAPEVLPSFPPVNEPKATLLKTSRSLVTLPTNSQPLSLVEVNTTAFLVTDKNIINLSTGEASATPETIRLAAAMDDLDSIFVLSTSNNLSIYSINTKQFTTNTLPLASGAKIDAMGAYLTYLYTLDKNASTISRFPRAEGGFGSPTNWLRDSISLGGESTMAVYENIALTLSSKEPILLSRGRRENIAFTGTNTLVTANAIAFDQKTGDLLALDKANKRIVRWSSAGTLLAQYFNESFANAQSISVSPVANELLVADTVAVTTWIIQ